MQSDELKQLNHRFYDEVFGRHNLDAIDELLTDDVVDHAQMPGQAEGRRGVKQAIGQILQAFPDLEVVIENEVAEGDTVASVVLMTGTHQGDFFGVPATGRRVSIESMDMSRVRGGRFCEHWGAADMAAMMAQLGVAPARL